LLGICDPSIAPKTPGYPYYCASNIVNYLFGFATSIVKWPSGMKVQETVDKFFQHKGFPGVLGAIDGSHIPIKTRKVDGEQYYNRKKFPSIILQAVCDQNNYAGSKSEQIIEDVRCTIVWIVASQTPK
jgi:hypothetical protein